MSRPVSLFSPGLPWWILMASLILLLDTWSSLSNIFATFRLHLCPVLSRCSPTAVLGCRPVVCSCSLSPGFCSFPQCISSHSCNISVGIPPQIVVQWVFCPLVSLVSLLVCLLVYVPQTNKLREILVKPKDRTPTELGWS